MNILIGFCVIFASTGLGYYLSLRYGERRKYYEDFYQFNNKLKIETVFTQKKIKEIIAIGKQDECFYIFLNNYFYNNSLPDKSKNLKKVDLELFCEYVQGIGNVDKYSQLTMIDKYNLELQKKKEESIEQEKKYKKVYIKLGFLIGLVVFILLI